MYGSATLDACYNTTMYHLATIHEFGVGMVIDVTSIVPLWRALFHCLVAEEVTIAYL